jgi:hypothetical protein
LQRPTTTSFLGADRAVRYNHIAGVNVTAEFAEEHGERYRYWLDIALQACPRPPLTACVIMMNPSYACVEFADKSVQFMERVVFQQELPEFEGVGRLIVVNQFAKIQTHKFQGLPHEVGQRNDAAIERAFTASDCVILGWGRANRFEERQAFAMDLLRRLPPKRILRTRTHPSRGRYNGFILPVVLHGVSR